MNEIDVSECQYYSKVDNCCHIFGNPLTATPCGYHKDCYYKQLQKEKQNAQDTYEMWQASLESIEILKQENEELKEAVKPYQTPDVVRILTMYITGDLDLLEKRVKKYEQKLEKIKDYCNCWLKTIDVEPIFRIIEGEENV